MLKKLSLILFVIASLFVCSLASAASVRLPSDAGKSESLIGEVAGGNIYIGTGVQYDSVDKIKLKDSSKLEYSSASAVIDVTYDKKYSIYGAVGQIINPQLIVWLDGIKNTYKCDNSLMWTAGANAVIVEYDGWQLFTDGGYSQTVKMDLKKFSDETGVYSKADFESLGETFQEQIKLWQMALGVTKDFEWIKPYAGVKYFYTKSTSFATSSGELLINTEKNIHRYGIFIGTQVFAAKMMEFNIQGRFVDEIAFMASATFKF